MKKFIAVIVTVILGAIGSGFWEVFLRPRWPRISNWILSLFSNYFNSLESTTYSEIAKGFHEVNGLIVFFLVGCGFILYLCDGLYNMFYIYRDSTEIQKKLSEAEEKIFAKAIQAPVADIEVKPKLDSEPLKKFRGSQYFVFSFRWLSLFFLFLFVAIIFSQIISLTQYVYVNSAVTYFNQLMTVCGPFINNEKSQALKSQFAQIQSRSDFLSLTNELLEIAKKRKLKTPEFEIW